jgi:WD40 repeat protein
VVTASADGAIVVWDAATGTRIGTPILAGGQVAMAAISPDAAKVLVVTLDGKAQVWNLADGTLTSIFEQDLVAFGTFSPDGDRLVTASSDGIARVWRIDSGEEVGAPLVHGGAILSVAFSPDGERLVTASADQSARVWHVRTGFPVSEPFWHRDVVVTARFSPDGNRVVTGSRDGTARVWDVPVGTAADVGRLADLAEANGGYRIEDEELVATTDRTDLLQNLAGDTAAPPAEPAASRSLARWLVADPWTRTISPLSRLSVPDYIGRLLAEGTQARCLEAWRTYPGHPALEPCAGQRSTRTTPRTQAGR